MCPRYRSGFSRRFLLAKAIVQYDEETKRILQLAIPFTCSSLVSTVSDLAILVIISETLGNEPTIAYIMVDAIVGVTSSFTGGWIEALSSLGSMAYGAENYDLVGRYAQTSVIVYVLSEIPFAFLWGFNIRKVILLMGFNENIAVMSESYVWLQVAMNVISCVNEALMDLLEVTEKQTYANVMYCISSVTHLGIIALSAFTMECSLIIFGLIFMIIECLFLFINIVIALAMGWIAPFEHGMYGELILFKDTSVVKQLFWTALPLSFGGLLAYAEWEILTVFAAILGPAEVFAWTLLGSVWNVFESTTSAIGDASEVRCAFHLGANAPALAKLCAYKCIFLAFMGSLVVTSSFLSLSNVLPAWLSHDATIQAMLSDCFPLIALGNITMDMGMVCWSLVGSQGRYKLATIVSTACSLLITIPLGAILTIWLRIDLTGLVFATVLGYTAVAMLLTVTLFMSDWRRLAIKIQEKVAVTTEVEEGTNEETPGQA